MSVLRIVWILGTFGWVYNIGGLEGVCENPQEANRVSLRVCARLVLLVAYMLLLLIEDNGYYTLISYYSLIRYIRAYSTYIDYSVYIDYEDWGCRLVGWEILRVRLVSGTDISW